MEHDPSHLLGYIPSGEHQPVAFGFRIYLCSLEVWLSDLIVIWRAWALFRDQQWVIIIPFVMWVAGVGG